MARQRLRGQFAPEYDELTQHFANDAAIGIQASETWLDAIAAFEKAAELYGKDEMHIYGITATEDELASELFSSFGGFFHHAYREHDYLVGRQKAQEFLARLNNPEALAQGDGLGPVRYQPLTIPPLPDLGKIKIADLDKEERKELRERILSRASRALEEAGISSMVVAPLRIFVLRPKLNKLLAL